MRSLISHRMSELVREGNLRNFVYIQKFYMELSILLTGFNGTYQKWLVVLENFVMAAVTLNLTTAILYFHPRGIVTAIVSFPLLLHLIKKSGAVYEESEKCLKSWRKIGYNCKWFVKYRRACRPLRIRFGDFFYADRGLMLTVLSTILGETANLVVTFGHK